jgi:hypothetical protein
MLSLNNCNVYSLHLSTTFRSALPHIQTINQCKQQTQAPTLGDQLIDPFF